MQINSVINSHIVQNQQNFKGNSAKNDADKKNTKKQSPNFFVKLLQHPSLIIIPFVPFSCYDIYAFFKEKSLKKQLEKSPIKEAKLKEFKKTYLKTGLVLFLTTIPLYFVTDYINNKYKDKNFAKAKKQIDYFNKKNKVDIKLVRNPIDEKNIALLGGFSPISAQIFLQKKIYSDILNANFRQKNVVKHELIHAQQYILMACSENGINKMNYIYAKRASERLSEKDKSEIQNLYEEIKNNKDNKYKNETITVNDYKINLTDYVTALYKIFHDKDTNPNNIPIIINKEFYEKAKAAKGPLTKEEKDKAELYLEAYEKYPAKIGFFDGINPFSDYKQNLLEKEAYSLKNTPYFL